MMMNLDDDDDDDDDDDADDDEEEEDWRSSNCNYAYLLTCYSRRHAA